MKGAPLSFEARFDGTSGVQARAAGARQSVGSAELIGLLEEFNWNMIATLYTALARSTPERPPQAK